MKKAHIIGVCGVAMSATAKLLQDEGWEVSGSDDSFYPPVSDYVNNLGITFFKGYSPENIPVGTSLIVIGRNAQLDPKENKEVQSAIASGITILSYPEVLQRITKGRDRIVIAGSYGKSTVTSLISWILVHAKKHPGYMIGAYPKDMPYTSTMGKGNTFVLEGDEYPTAHGDDTSKFLYYNPQTLLLTSVDHDHVNVFPTYEDYQKPFITLLKNLPKDGLLMACVDNEGVNIIGHHTDARISTYGITNDAIWTGKNISYGETTTFDLRKNGITITTIATTLLGAHNIQNIVGAAALLLEKNLVTPEEITSALSGFNGIKRRLNRITHQDALPAYEGFGTSYEKARAAIQAIQLHYPEKEMIILFEPHTFSWRNRDTIDWYDTVFKEAKDVLVYHPAEQGSQTHDQLSQKEIVERVNASGVTAHSVNNEKEIHKKIRDNFSMDSVFLILTSGNLDGALDTLPSWINTLKK